MDDKERIREGITLLLENFWFTRKYDLDKYLLIRQNRKEIQKYFIDNFGYQLVINNAVVKLEKIPSETASWMGIQDFSDPLDYAFFMAILSYLEEKSTDDIFIVSMLSEHVKQFLSQEMDIRWENYRQRLSFVRVMKYAENQQLLEVMEGEIDLYKDDETIEVLYRPTMISKYFMRFFSKPVQEFQSQKEMLEDRWKTDGFETPKIRRQSITRKLLTSPIVYRNVLNDEEKKYFANYGYSIIDAFEEYTPYEVETYRNELLLISKRRNVKIEQYPDGKMLSQIALQFGYFIQKKAAEREKLPEFEWEISGFVFENWVEELQAINGHGWSKEYREKYPQMIAKELIPYLQEWKMLKEDEKAHSIILYPAITRIGGQYPMEYHFQRYFIEKLKKELGKDLHEKQEHSIDISNLEKWITDFKEKFELQRFSFKRVEDSIGSLVTIDQEHNICVIDMGKVRKRDH